MPKRTKSYDDWQMEKLANPATAASFLNAARADSQEMLLVALRKVSQAREMSKVAKEAGVQRETLYHAFSKEGNPTLTTLLSTLSALEMDVKFVPKYTPSTVGSGLVPLMNAASKAASASLNGVPLTEVSGPTTTYFHPYGRLPMLTIPQYQKSSFNGPPQYENPKELQERRVA